MRDENKRLVAEIYKCSDGERAEELAERLCDFYRGLAALVSADPEYIANAMDATEGLAVLPKLLGCIASRRITDRFKLGVAHTEAEIREYLIGVFIGIPVESVFMLSFDGKGRAIALDFLGDGTVNASDIWPRKMVEKAVRRGAKSVVIAHNHPGGNAKPSAEDHAATNSLASVLATSGIKLSAHYVVSGNACTAANGS